MYCYKCGEKCIEEKKQTGFHEKTGDPEYHIKYTCPVDRCYHKGREHDWKDIDYGVWSLFHYFFKDFTGKPEYRCSKCGEERRVNYYEED
jgi:hypothetical protein